VIILAGGLAMLFGGASVVSNALGRGKGMSGRTEIWAAVISAAGNPIIGTGYESFWISPNAQKVWRSLLLAGWWDVGINEAHNGYLDIYLNLGCIGLFLIALILIGGYRRTIRAFQYDPEVASLMLAYIATLTFYSMTEAGFRELGYSWFFLLLAVVSANGVLTGRFEDVKPKIPAPRGGTLARTSAVDDRISENETVYASRRP